MKESSCIREEPWDILCRIIKQDGTCAAGHKVGDEILFSDNEIKGRICMSALYSMLPKVYAMMYNARFPWLKNQCSATHACPDGHNPVIFEVSRIERKQHK
jgi:uncharacterized repeat protein (TIGR04076 family)